ncbi:homoserine dehydrogenase [Methanotorris igneus]|uniref:Homoserine dehydrogenase n=1 Tax=Methanotorris igneus (strain DSM 5666 / JCM 11834 / Kol 5) TaxID=880724 RepID=F6BDR2_METIK|nr:homoserine dehydrogenase [Methanotorris igneus]AEF96623.1 homoserine dehydrogenase [Methanotorris igneus Kol 5]
MKIILVGFGVIGRGVAKVIDEKKKLLKEKYGFEPKIVAICDSSGAAIDESGLDLKKAIEVKEKTGKIANYNGKKISSVEVIESIDADVVVEATPTNIKTGEPARTHILKAFENGKHVVTANKGPLALYFKELVESAEKHGVMFRYEASVGGAMPIINLAKETLAGNEIKSIKGILNGTTNYILTKMEKEKLDFNTVLKEAQELGIAETDPSQDIYGYDTAAKIVILANSIMGMNKTIDDVKIEGITRITPEAIELANKSGYTIKLIGEVKKNKLVVEPRLVQLDSPLNVKGTLNVAMFNTDLAKEVVIVGRGAGATETASAILSDLINIHLKVKEK